MVIFFYNIAFMEPIMGRQDFFFPRVTWILSTLMKMHE